jgi:hypothetical protein
MLYCAIVRSAGLGIAAGLHATLNTQAFGVGGGTRADAAALSATVALAGAVAMHVPLSANVE